jgi:cytidine deaminase
MDLQDLDTADQRVVDAAIDAAKRAFSPDGDGRFDGDAHIVSAAVEGANGEIYTAASLPASVGRASTCAEPGALGAAVADGVHDVERVAAVEHPRSEDDEFRALSPCGVCRELLADYGSDIRVVVREADADGTETGVTTVDELLPARTW